MRITVITLGRGDRRETAGRLRGGRVRGIGGMADDESFFVSADEADDDGRRAPGHAPPRATPRDPAATTTTTTTMARRRLGSDSDDDDAVDRTANETMEDSDASFVSGDDAGGDALGRGARDAGAETTTTTETAIAVGGEASGTDGEFVSGADTDTGVDGRARPTGTRARAPGRAPPLRTTQATAPALSEGRRRPRRILISRRRPGRCSTRRGNSRCGRRIGTESSTRTTRRSR